LALFAKRGPDLEVPIRIAVKAKSKKHEKKASRSQDNSPLPGSPMNLEGGEKEWKAGAWRRPRRKLF